MLQDYKRGIEYKSLSEREREPYYKVFLKLLIWGTSNRRNLSFAFVVFIDVVNHGKLTWVGKVKLSVGTIYSENWNLSGYVLSHASEQCS